MIVTLFVVSVIIFVLARIGGDPRSLLLDDYASAAQWEQLGVELGLDKPSYQQYGIFMMNAFQGDFGQSIMKRKPVIDVIGSRVWATAELAIAAFLFAIVVGIPLGVLSSIKRGSKFDQFGKVVALIGQSAPSFWLGIMLMFWFAVGLGWVPPSGREDWNSIFLPMITLSWVFIAGNLRLMRSAMLDVLDSEYIKLARAKGVSGRAVIWRHAFRNALIPPLTFAGVNMGSLMTGSVTTELVFAWPGMGQLAIQAVLNFDYPLIQGITIVFTLLFVGAALVVDMLYAYLDPRIRYT
jgi:peptide/nickel transport system permease protein